MKKIVLATALAGLALAVAGAARTQERTVRMGLSAAGLAVFQRNCAACHVEEGRDSADPRAPRLSALRQYTPERILAALDGGLMKVQGAALSDADRREVAEFLSARQLGAAQAGDARTMPNRCAGPSRLVAGPSWNGWSVDGRNARFQTTRDAGLTAASLPKLRLKWAFGLPSGVQAFSQPTVYGGQVFVGGDGGQVYALDARTGCVHWSFLANGAVRTAPLVVQRAGAAPLVVIGDMKAELYALDALTGAKVWSKPVDDQPLARITGAPTAHAGRLYVPVSTSEEGSARLPGYECCRHRGSVVAVDLADGRVLWKTYMMDPAKPGAPDAQGRRTFGPAGGAIWSAPTIDAKRRRIYVATGDAYSGPAGKLTDAIVALDMDTGAIAWAHQDVADDVWVAGCRPGVTEKCPPVVGPDWDYGSSAMLLTVAGGRDLIVAGHKGGTVVALDPDRSGAAAWRVDLAKAPAKFGPAEILYGGAADGRRAYFSLAEAGAFTAVDLASGRTAWSVPIVNPADRAGRKGGSAAVTGLPGAVLSGGLDGVLRAFSTADGKLLWSYDTVRGFDSVNGIPARGGSMGAPGPTIAGGMLFVGSGYVGTTSGMPGNAILAFGL